MGLVIFNDGHEVHTEAVDYLLCREIDEKPGIVIHQKSGETISCVFKSTVDRRLIWEALRMAFAGETDYYDSPNLFFRLGAVTAISRGEHTKYGPFIQMSFRGEETIIRPFENKGVRDEDFIALSALFAGRLPLTQ